MKLRNTKTGVVVFVSDDTATRLGPGWVPVEAEKPAPKPRAKKKS